MLIPSNVASQLNANHYLGSRGARGKMCYSDTHGSIVFSGPSSRMLPRDWLELSRWCLVDGKGSVQWAACLDWLRAKTETSTVVSYSDPSVGHNGALYRACGFVWAPTWLELRPPPTGGGTRGGKKQAAKSRWVYLLRPDDRRELLLSLKDESIARRYPWVGYTEPRWSHGKPVLTPAIMQRPRLWRNRATG